MDIRYSEKDQRRIDLAKETLRVYEGSLLEKLKGDFHGMEKQEYWVDKAFRADPMRSQLQDCLCTVVSMCLPVYRVKIDPDQVCPECFRTMDIILTNFNGSGTVKNFVCPVCHPDKKEVEND